MNNGNSGNSGRHNYNKQMFTCHILRAWHSVKCVTCITSLKFPQLRYVPNTLIITTYWMID